MNLGIALGRAQAPEGNFDSATKEAWRLAIIAICDAMKSGLE